MIQFIVKFLSRPTFIFKLFPQCSEKCGEGLITRHVFCGLFDEDKIISIEDDDNCDTEKKPATSEICNGAEKCENEWYTAKFGKVRKILVKVKNKTRISLVCYVLWCVLNIV